MSDGKQLRSRITNGATVDGDNRSAWARRMRDVIHAHLSDLGGEEAVSQAEKSIIRRVATLTVELERMEAVFAEAGEALPDQLDLYQRTAGNLRRLLEAIGIGRRARPVQSLQEYLASKERS
jgi:hypothetical protein